MLHRALSRRHVYVYNETSHSLLSLQHYLSLSLANRPQLARLLAAPRLGGEDHSRHYRPSRLLRLHAAHRREHARHVRVRSAYR